MSMLNNNDPTIEPWVILDILVLCLQGVRQSQTKLTALLSKPYAFSFAINKLRGKTVESFWKIC